MEVYILQGTVKFFHNRKKYGFITPDDGGEDLFFHISALEEGVDVGEGDSVEFELEQGDKGPKAINVTKL